MCGIFGGLISDNSPVTVRELRWVIDRLFRFSESRGREAAGLAALTPRDLYVFKAPVAASKMLRSQDYDQLHRVIFNNGLGQNGHYRSAATALIGHSRLVTNGLAVVHDNNQPVVSDGFVGVHNGIVVNERDLWRKHAALTRRYEVDTEVILQLLRKYLKDDGTVARALGRTYQEIYGETTIAVMAVDLDCLVLGTNTGSLYIARSPSHGLLIFASERYILERVKARGTGERLLADAHIEQVPPRTAWVVDVASLKHDVVRLDSAAANGLGSGRMRPARAIRDLSPPRSTDSSGFPNVGAPAHVPRGLIDEYDRRRTAIGDLRRCSKCVLPETMPFIAFDESGVCNYCINYLPIQPRGRAALEEALRDAGAERSKPQILVTFSGGRDSSYGLHYLVRELGVRPIAYTYDWGMVTDLARRNQARLCGTLGVEHIWVSADIRKKRENIRKNVTAWLRRPDLGMIPLFMAGDKQFFYYANQVRQQTKLSTVVLCENLLEKTAFKSGFCGIRPSHAVRSVYALSLKNKLKMAGYYATRYVANPGYFNASLWDTVAAYGSYYVIDHNFLSLYQYVEWDEREIESVLIKEYDWEIAPDTKSTWRIGDGTAPFYNYLYYIVAGFTENDTFRSNQVREGKLDRTEALRRVAEDNRPRFDSFKWYCDIIGLDYLAALRRVHEIRPLYADLLDR